MTWGPWIEHDGKGCPCVGRYVEVWLRSGEREECIAGAECRAKGYSPDALPSAWVHEGTPGDVMIYRIRKPKGMEILEELIALPDALTEEEIR